MAPLHRPTDELVVVVRDLLHDMRPYVVSGFSLMRGMLDRLHIGYPQVRDPLPGFWLDLGMPFRHQLIFEKSSIGIESGS